MLMVVAPALYLYIPEAYVALAGVAGTTSPVGLDLVDLVLTIVKLGLVPLGAVLIGAGVVIKAFAGKGDADTDGSVEAGPGRTVEVESTSRVRRDGMVDEGLTAR